MLGNCKQTSLVLRSHDGERVCIVYVKTVEIFNRRLYKFLLGSVISISSEFTCTCVSDAMLETSVTMPCNWLIIHWRKHGSGTWGSAGKVHCLQRLAEVKGAELTAMVASWQCGNLF